MTEMIDNIIVSIDNMWNQLKSLTFTSERLSQYVTWFVLSFVWISLVVVFSYPWFTGFVLSNEHNFWKSVIDSSKELHVFIINIVLCIFFYIDMFTHQVLNKDKKDEKSIFKPLFFCASAMILSCFLFIFTRDELTVNSTINACLKSNTSLYLLWGLLLIVFLLMKYFGFRYVTSTERIENTPVCDENMINDINSLNIYTA